MTRLAAKLLAITTVTLLLGPALAPPPALAAAPAVEFTKIQNLNPNAPATNRLVKQKWAVVIGASKFKEHRLTPAGSDNMDQSAKDFYSYLTDGEAGRFDRSHVKLLVNDSATRQNIMTALGAEWLGRTAGPDDLVVVYVATSAFPTTDGNAYLCAYDCALDNIYGTCISIQSLMETLRHNVHCDRILLVLQAAYSGAAELESGAKALYSGYNIDLDKVLLGKGYIILSSSQPNEITWSNAFSKNLIAALRQERGLISLQKAFAMARLATERDTAQANPTKKQTPVMKTDWSGSELVIGTPPLEKVSELPDNVTCFLSAEACYLKATQSLQNGAVDDAIKEYEKAVTADPKYADALADYGAALTLKSDWQGAATMYERAIAVHPNDQLFHLNYARILLKLGRQSDCMSELAKCYALNKKDMSVLTALASQYLEARQAQDAVRFLNEAATLYPARANIQERLSYALAKAGDTDEAIAHAKEAVRLDPGSASARLNLGSALLIAGNTTEATSAYREAIKLAPSNADAHYLLSRALERAGDNKTARSELEQFTRLCSPDDARLPKARQHLLEL